jgi:DNA polymerase-4
MKEESYRGKIVTVKIRFTDFKTYTRSKTLDEFTDSEPKIRRAAFECLGRFELKLKVRLIGVRISHLEKVEN